MEEPVKPVIITEPKNSNSEPATPAPLRQGNVNTKKKKSNKLSRLLAALVVTLLLAGAAGYGGAKLYEEGRSGNAVTLPMSSKNDGNAVVTTNEESIANVAKTVSPSVVSILTTTQQSSRFYSQTYEQQGAGTGIIVSKDGYIMTNKHVVDGAREVTVALSSGETYESVQVVGVDPLNDIAFLKVKNVKDLPAAELGDSKTIRIGQTVVAIGNALGQYSNTVTSGIVSGTGRPIVASSDGTSRGATESLNDLIQTDAAINSGNSGGPLLNLKGQVIGVNTAVASQAQGIGFSIPIGATKGMLAHLIETGKVERPYLGVQYVSINPQVKKEYKLSVSQGDLVTASRGDSVQRGGPAAKAGVKDGDIITAVNDIKVGEVANVATLISEYRPSDKIEITVLRDGKQRTLSVTLGAYDS